MCVAGMYLDCMTETKNFFIYTLQSSIYCLFLNFCLLLHQSFWVGRGGEGEMGGDGGDGTGCVYHMILDPPLLHF